MQGQIRNLNQWVHPRLEPLLVSRQSSCVSKRIYQLLDKFRNHSLSDSSDVVDLADRYHIQKIAQLVEREEPVHFLLPAFPAKSPNPEKTHASSPDFGEVLALHHLNTLCQQISDLYAPGARVTICSDGHVFGDIVQVNDATVTAYGQAINKIIDEYVLTKIATFHLEDVFGELSYERMRQEMIRSYGRSVDEIREDVLTKDAEKNLFNGIHRFMFEDLLVLHPLLSRNAAREQAKTLAYEVIQRSHAWSSLVEQKFPAAVRLSIHPQLRSSQKFGIKLLPGDDAWRTPWHGVALQQKGLFSIVKKSQALALGAKETSDERGYVYFTADEQSPNA